MIISACPSPLSRISLHSNTAIDDGTALARDHSFFLRPTTYLIQVSLGHPSVIVSLVSTRIFNSPIKSSQNLFRALFFSLSIEVKFGTAFDNSEDFHQIFFPRQESRIKLHLRSLERHPSSVTVLPTQRAPPHLEHPSCSITGQTKSRPLFQIGRARIPLDTSQRPPVPTRFNPIRSTTFTKFYRAHPLLYKYFPRFLPACAPTRICLRLSIDPLAWTGHEEMGSIS